MYKNAELFIWIVILLLVSFYQPAVAGEEPFSCADLLKLRIVGDPVISPDGRWVACTVMEPPDTAGGEELPNSDIWVVDFEGKQGSRPFAFGRADERSPRWSPDGRWIAFASDRDREDKMQIYRIRLAGGEAEKVTSFKEGISSFTWSPDGERLAVIALDPLPEEVELARERGDDERVIDGDDRFGRLWVIDSSTGEGEAITPDSLHVQSVDWSPDGARIAMVVSDRPTSNEMYFNSRLEVIRLSSRRRKVLSENAQGTPAWSRDARSIAFNYSLEHPEVTVAVPVIAVIDAEGSNLRFLGKKHRGSLRDPQWLDGGNELIVVELAGVIGKLAILSVKDDKVEHFEEILVPYYGRSVFDISRDGSRIAVIRGSAQSPPDLWGIERGWFGKKRKLTDANPWLAGRSLPTAQAVKWTSRDGTEIEGVLFLPPGYERGKRYPAVLEIHGGPMWAWWLGWHASWHEWAIPLACRGFVVLLPNPRGSLGYGVGFARANFDDWGGGDFEDILAGADFLMEEGYADPGRIGIGGWSYGGYMSAWAVTQTKRFAAAVVGAGVTNLFSFHGTTDITPVFLSKYFRDTAYRRPDAYRSHSAINYIRQAGTPTLILHGEEDKRVPVGQAYEF
ncbi:MAG: S9 family peptidase [Candidatus Krumholzibacteria bacterium]|nr:S9 family peptidase [Candidatus Krumholzibacteria bacterium]